MRRERIPEECDLVALSAHKIHGPKGVGALWIRDGLALEPLLHGGGQEPGGRSGTLSPALCAGFGAAAKLAKQRFGADHSHARQLFDAGLRRDGEPRLDAQRLARGALSGQSQHPPGRARRRAADVRSARHRLLGRIGLCRAARGGRAMCCAPIGLSDAEARSSIRIGFGRYTSEEELMTALDRIEAAARAQKAAA
ncbi:MAG: aminotransferase class V-fold PLP-dependent enzyme [Sphingomonas sp.]